LEDLVVECVANFSEGRNEDTIQKIVDAIDHAPGTFVLDSTADIDHNRSVVTFAAPPHQIAEAAFRGIQAAVASIDLNHHQGVHPRIGAADVVPFVPALGVTLAECVRIAEECGARVWRDLALPVYLYEAAARRPDRRKLESVRRGNFERLRQEVLTNSDRRPDFGDAALHPTAGATIIGARKFLIAFNVNLNTPDVEIARHIAVRIRASSGGFPAVKAMGVPLKSRKLSQVTMNLTDFERTPVHVVFEAIRSEAAIYGVGIAGSEIIGLIPLKALEHSGAWLPTVENFRDDVIFERRLELCRRRATIQSNQGAR
jgi:glutamate formiminotransferase